jgi:hypothetical protein
MKSIILLMTAMNWMLDDGWLIEIRYLFCYRTPRAPKTRTGLRGLPGRRRAPKSSQVFTGLRRSLQVFPGLRQPSLELGILDANRSGEYGRVE